MSLSLTEPEELDEDEDPDKLLFLDAFLTVFLPGEA